MAKKLNEIWKTFYGAFFESEEEALKAELRRRVSDAIKVAWDKTMKAKEERDKAHRDEMKARGWPYGEISQTRYVYSRPAGFEDEVAAQLEAAGLFASQPPAE